MICSMVCAVNDSLCQVRSAARSIRSWHLIISHAPCEEKLCLPSRSEMAFARQLLKGDRKERAMLRRADNEKTYGAAGGQQAQWHGEGLGCRAALVCL